MLNSLPSASGSDFSVGRARLCGHVQVTSGGKEEEKTPNYGNNKGGQSSSSTLCKGREGENTVNTVVVSYSNMHPLDEPT